jgi:hypothetical protein
VRHEPLGSSVTALNAALTQVLEVPKKKWRYVVSSDMHFQIYNNREGLHKRHVYVAVGLDTAICHIYRHRVSSICAPAVCACFDLKASTAKRCACEIWCCCLPTPLTGYSPRPSLCNLNCLRFEFWYVPAVLLLVLLLMSYIAPWLQYPQWACIFLFRVPTHLRFALIDLRRQVCQL